VTENPSNQAESSIEKSSHKVLEKKKNSHQLRGQAVLPFSPLWC